MRTRLRFARQALDEYDSSDDITDRVLQQVHRALSGRLKFTVRRHKFNKDSLSSYPKPQPPFPTPKILIGRQTPKNLEGKAYTGSPLLKRLR